MRRAVRGRSALRGVGAIRGRGMESGRFRLPSPFPGTGWPALLRQISLARLRRHLGRRRGHGPILAGRVGGRESPPVARPWPSARSPAGLPWTGLISMSHVAAHRVLFSVRADLVLVAARRPWHCRPALALWAASWALTSRSRSLQLLDLFLLVVAEALGFAAIRLHGLLGELQPGRGLIEHGSETGTVVLVVASGFGSAGLFVNGDVFGAGSTTPWGRRPRPIGKTW